MSLSDCPCGGTISLGPVATNTCDKCGRYFWDQVPGSMNQGELGTFDSKSQKDQGCAWKPPVPPASPTKVEAILAERGSRYGKFIDHATISQTLKFALQNHMGDRWHDMKPDQREALEMLCHKIGRIANGDPNYEDSWRDIAGYATLVADRLLGVEK